MRTLPFGATKAAIKELLIEGARHHDVMDILKHWLQVNFNIHLNEGEWGWEVRYDPLRFPINEYGVSGFVTLPEAITFALGLVNKAMEDAG